MSATPGSQSRSSATLTITVRVQARASRSEIQGYVDGKLRIRTTAPPVDGKANKDVLRQLARAYKVPASHVTLLRGASNRDKVFRISSPRAESDFDGAHD